MIFGGPNYSPILNQISAELAQMNKNIANLISQGTQIMSLTQATQADVDALNTQFQAALSTIQTISSQVKILVANQAAGNPIDLTELSHTLASFQSIEAGIEAEITPTQPVSGVPTTPVATTTAASPSEETHS